MGLRYFQDVPHRYNVRNGFQRLIAGVVVTFTTPDEEKLPLPSPKFLSLHATCSKVAYLSGTADYFESLTDPDYDLDASDYSDNNSD